MTDVQRALLGDREAARRVTARHELLPCPFCGSNNIMCGKNLDHITSTVVCKDCANSVGAYRWEWEVRLAWNTRAPILSAEEMEMLHGKENP